MSKELEKRIESLENYVGSIQRQMRDLKSDIHEGLTSSESDVSQIKDVLIKATEPFKMSKEFVEKLRKDGYFED